MIRQVLAIAGKELRLFARDPGALALTFLMPFMFIVVMSAALQGMFDPEKGRPVRLLVVNRDRGPRAAAVIAQLRTLDSFHVKQRWHGRPLDRPTAERLVTEQDRTVALVFPPRFSEVLSSPRPRARARVQILVDPVASLQYVEPIRGVVAGVLRQSTYLAAVPREVDALLDVLPLRLTPAQRQAILTRAREAFAPERLTRRAQRVSLERAFPAGQSLSDYPDTFQQNVPGYTIFGMFWIVTLLATSVLAEQRGGTFRRMEAAPVSRAALLAGKLVPYFGICALQLVLMLGTGALLYDMSLGPSLAGLALVGLATAASATSLGVLVAGIARTEAQATSLTTLVLLSLAALGGCFVPRFIMPDWLRSASLITPHGWALDGFQDLLVRGQGFGAVVPEVGVLLVFSTVFFAVGVWRFRFNP